MPLHRILGPKSVDLSAIMLFAILVLFIGSYVEASHFRGAIFMWEPRGPNTIHITYRIAWRLTWNSDTFCNQSVIDGRQLIGIDSMTCFSGCLGTIAPLLYHCTDYSPLQLEDWSSGIGSVNFTSGSSVFTFGFSSCCWITLGSGSGSWSMQAKVDLRHRSDISRINTSPTVDLPLLVRLQNGCNHTIVLPVNDVDGDKVRCRWAVGSECAGVCQSFPGSTLDEDSCKLTYIPTRSSGGYYAVAIQVEDFASYTSTVPLSSVPFQFLVYVYNTNEGCGSVPEFIPPTPADEECFSLDVGDDFGISITARSNRSLQSIGTTSAIGMRKSPEIIWKDGQWNYIKANITWTPKPEDGGKEHNLCFYAVDVLGLTTPVRCLKIPVSVKGPTPLRVERVGVSNTWTIVLDQLFQRPNISAFIEVFETLSDIRIFSVDVAKSKDVLYNPDARQINVTFHYNFDVDTKYHVTIPSGLVQGFVDCQSLSVAIDDSTFWKVEIDCGSLDLENGAEYAPNGTVYPETVFYTCNPGFNLVGSGQRTCLVNRTWTGVEPQCVPKDCGPYNAQQSGSSVSSPTGSTVFNTTVWFYCDIGHTLIGVSSMRCDTDGNWDNIPPSCIITDCGSLSAPENGMIEVSSTVYGAVVVYTCKTGYKLQGNSSRHCLASAKWNGSEPTCEIMDCGPLKAPKNGKIHQTTTKFSSSVTFSCDEGYQLVGEEKTVCTEDGWSSNTPLCQQKEDEHADDCTAEHGRCTNFIYTRVRVRALVRSGCKKFCQCAHASTELDGSVTYRWQEHLCPAGTLFEDSVQVCVHSFMATCPVIQTYLDNALMKDLSPDGSQKIAGLSDSQKNTCEQEQGTCDSLAFHDTDRRLVAMRSSGCKKFCLCAQAPESRDQSESYYWVDLSCPPGTLFDDSLQPRACNHEGQVQCLSVTG